MWDKVSHSRYLFGERELIECKENLKRQRQKSSVKSKRTVLLGLSEEHSVNVNNNLTEPRIQRNSSIESFTDYEGELHPILRTVYSRCEGKYSFSTKLKNCAQQKKDWVQGNSRRTKWRHISMHKISLKEHFWISMNNESRCVSEKIIRSINIANLCV